MLQDDVDLWKHAYRSRIFKLGIRLHQAREEGSLTRSGKPARRKRKRIQKERSGHNTAKPVDQDREERPDAMRIWRTASWEKFARVLQSGLSRRERIRMRDGTEGETSQRSDARVHRPIQHPRNQEPIESSQKTIRSRLSVSMIFLRLGFTSRSSLLRNRPN
ncbi:uncharacterized protein LOC112494214 [Cephus cinctus]|uniref:Uncharacterized protein LOC112494214 n=1 Tax=Cephus cinctus TaxID=211228 RepID=A0AAJ7W0C9_CEPCN|nr:uncharacterized protein LOC112494214 [Cephus cinctus]